MTQGIEHKVVVITGASSGLGEAAARQKAGRITAASTTREVAFEPVDGPIDNRVDNAQWTKHRGSPYLGPLVGARTRSATVRVTPRDTDA